MKSPDAMGDFSRLPYTDAALYSGRLAKQLPPRQDRSLESLLNPSSQVFRIDMNHSDSRFVMSAAEDRMQTTKIEPFKDYVAELEKCGTESSAIFRQIMSAPDGGLTITSRDRLVKLCELIHPAISLDSKLRTWVPRCGLGYNVINLVLVLEEMLFEAFGSRADSVEYKVFATDIDHQFTKTANKLAIPSFYQDTLDQDTLYDKLPGDIGALLRLKSNRRKRPDFAVHSHLQDHSLADINLFVATILAQKLSAFGQQVLLQNIKTSLIAGGIVLCADAVLAELLVAKDDFAIIDSDCGLYQRVQTRSSIINPSERYIRDNHSVPERLIQRPRRRILDSAGNKETPNVTSLFPRDDSPDLGALILIKNDYIDLLQLEIDDLYNQIQDMTDELSTSLEELETVNEELRISNDQLITVNDQYSYKLEELSLYLKDYDQITNSLKIALIFVDRSKKIRFFNSRAEGLFDLCLRDLNRCFADFLFAKALNLENLFFQARNYQAPASCEVSFKGINHRFVKAMPFVVQQVNCEGILFCIGDADGMYF